MNCPVCEGRGCDECSHGKIRITSCPREVMTAKSDELYRFARYVRKSGLWPVSGGALDQTPAFLTAESMIRSDTATWRSEMGLPDG